MNKQEETYFAALSKDRSEIADVLERRAVRGYKDSVVEKYSDQAHFIYELLQNADDACATRARFILEENRLIQKLKRLKELITEKEVNFSKNRCFL